MEAKGRLSSDELSRYMKIIWWLRRFPVHTAWILFGISMSPHQRITFRAMWESEVAGLKLSRGLSKTFLDGLILDMIGILYKNATQVVLTKGFRGGKLVLREACEPIILGALDGQVRKQYAIRCLAIFKKSQKAATYHVINKGSDMWTIDFSHESDIKTGPLGSESSQTSPLRGLRANATLVLDESADISNEQYTSVIRPFSRVGQNPVVGANRTNVIEPRRIESGTIKFDWQRYTLELDRMYKEMRSGNRRYCVVEFNYEDTFHWVNNVKPKEKFDIKEEIKKGNIFFTYKLNLADIFDEILNGETSMEDFMAENKNKVLLSAGTEFSTELVESCTGNEIDKEYVDEGDSDPESVMYNKDKHDRTLAPLLRSDDPCVLGIDPARENDEAAFVLIRLGPKRKCKAPFCDIINARSFMKQEYQTLYEVITDYYLERFPNIKLIVMDRGGGGLALRDLLWRPSGGRAPIYDPADENNPAEVVSRGNNILRLDQATNESNTLRVNFVKGQMQTKKIQFPPFIYYTGNREYDEQYRTIKKLRQQFTYIVSSPSGNWKKYSVDSRYKKDLFSATLLAMQGVYDLLYKAEERPKIVTEMVWV